MAESESGSESWLTTYADFITLLLTFFILLYALTSGVNKKKFHALIGVFQKGRGVLKHESVTRNEIPPLRIHRMQNWQKFNKEIKKRGLQNEVHFKIGSNGVYITLGGPVTFKTYSAELKSEAGEVLTLIAQSIQKYAYEPLKTVKVYGNTDNRPVAEGAAKFPSNWALGAARAISVVQFLVEHSEVPGKKFEVVSFGKYHPVASNTTEEGRSKNRRVKIFVEYKKQQAESTKKDSLLLRPVD